MSTVSHADPRPRAGQALARRWLARADATAVRASAAPALALAALIAVNLGLAALGIPLGMLVADDPAAWFREGMPGTWLSAAELLAAAAVAWAVHTRAAGGAPRRWHADFWGMCAVALAGLTVVELAQPTVFLGHWLEESLGTVAPFGMTNVDATLLVMLLAGLGGVLAYRAAVLLRHPRAAALLVCAVALGLASQGLDSFVPVSAWEFVAEETLKALGEPFLVAGFLVALAATRAEPHALDPHA